MPYAPPIARESSHTRNHRRSASSPIANSPVFLSLPRIPRRHSQNTAFMDDRDDDNHATDESHTTPAPDVPTPKRALFSVNDDDSSDSDSDSDNDSVEEQQEVTKIVRALAASSPVSLAPPTPLPPLKINSAIPFPTIADSRSPSPTNSNSSPLPRTNSGPVILSNGKVLKPSLKSSSAPHLPDALHLRSRSVPSTPSGAPKNVHFKEERDLESVRVFNRTGKPANLNFSAAEETETETEYDSSVPTGYPFPSIADEEIYKLAPSPASSNIPLATVLPESTHVILESINVPHAYPPSMRGTVLVRNITFAKSVAIRFTLDDWQTTSEVTACYVTSVPALPPPFRLGSAPTTPSQATDKQAVGWDWAAAVTRAEWDRFSFTIKLEDVERKLLYSTMFVAVRFQAHGVGGGEWWDNNQGKNYRLEFQRAESDRPAAKPFSIKSQSMFSAASSSPSFPPSNARSFNPGVNTIPFNTRPSTPARAHSNPTIPTYTSLGTITRKSKLSLSNYIAPTSPPADDETSQLVESRAQAPAIISADMGPPEISGLPGAMIGGMPATAPISTLQWPSPQSTSSSPESLHPSLSSSISTLNQLPTPVETPPKTDSPTTSAIFNAGGSHENESYAEFVKRWCFHQSPPPVSPGASLVSSPTSLNPWLESYDATRYPQGIMTGF